MDYVIGCDVGSQAVKVIMLSAEGQIVGEAEAVYDIDFPHPTWAEQDANDWIRGIVQAVVELIKITGVEPRSIRAIGLDAQVDGFVPIDKAGNPLHPAIIWMDRRAVQQVETIREKCEESRLVDISGLNLDPYHVAPKIRWFADTHAHLYEKARYFLLPGSYVAYRLTGELAVDYSNASSTLLMDVRNKQWSSELCDCFQIPIENLAPIYPANKVIGHLRQEFVELTGLSQQTDVILGCGDEHAASLGAGVISPGLVCDITGTAEPICAASRAPMIDQTGLVETHCHADPDLWLLENPGFVSGGNYRWLRDQFAPDQVLKASQLKLDPYDLLNQEAETVPPGSDGLVMLPCLSGGMTPTWNAKARGVFSGFSLAHRRAHFVRAVLEASAYGLRDITDRMQAMGLALEQIRAVGGGARSPLWRQIKADVTGLPVTLLQTVESTALGAGLLALAGKGYTGTLAEAVESSVHIIETRFPDPITAERYQAYYQIYRSTYFAMQPVFEQASRISQ
jgi:xylulokinase